MTEAVIATEFSDLLSLVKSSTTELLKGATHGARHRALVSDFNPVPDPDPATITTPIDIA